MPNLLDFTGKVVIVTGARTGIGQAAAIVYAEHGAKVVLAGRRPCDETQQRIAEFGGDSISVECDVSKEQDVINLIQKTIETYGRLDIAVNCAGCPAPPARLADQTVEDFDRVMAVDARGIFLCMKYEIPEILKVGGGAIVNIASVAGVIADPDMGPYAAAKHAVVGMTRAAGIEYAKDNLRINCVCPGLVNSEMTGVLREIDPGQFDFMASCNWQNRPADAQEIGTVCLFLGSEMASFMNGAIVPVDAGQIAH